MRSHSVEDRFPGVSAEITERTIEVDGIEVFLRETEGEGPPTVFVHGNPTHSEDWLPFLEQIEGPAIAFDLPGFGRSARPDPIVFDHTLGAYANFVERLLDQLAPDGYALVVHDWGGLALIPAQRHPDRVKRLVIFNAVPLLPGFRWHWIARIWRRRGLGELFNATSTRAATALVLRQARAGYKPMPPGFVDMVWDHMDAGTRRAVLALYRSADPERLAAAGSRLGELRCPALVAWAADDPYISDEFGRAYAKALPNAELLELDRAGHWPWIDRPELVDRVVGFLEA